jgi:DNA polymerase
MQREMTTLPEDFVPQYAKECNKCELCLQRKRMIWGEGYPRAPVMVLLDNPGAREDNAGIPLICGTRQTLQNLALQAGINLEQLYITYVVKCRPLRSYNKRQARATCLEYFHRQVYTQQPKIILCLGNVALQALLDNDAAEVKTFRGYWHTWNGFTMVSSYHPLAVRRRPNLFPYALRDWEMVAQSILHNHL